MMANELVMHHHEKEASGFNTSFLFHDFMRINACAHFFYRLTYETARLACYYMPQRMRRVRELNVTTAPSYQASSGLNIHRQVPPARTSLLFTRAQTLSCRKKMFFLLKIIFQTLAFLFFFSCSQQPCVSWVPRRYEYLIRPSRVFRFRGKHRTRAMNVYLCFRFFRFFGGQVGKTALAQSQHFPRRAEN